MFTMRPFSSSPSSSVTRNTSPGNLVNVRLASVFLHDMLRTVLHSAQSTCLRSMRSFRGALDMAQFDDLGRLPLSW